MECIEHAVDQEIEQGRGFYLKFKLDQKEVELLKSIVREQWLNIIKKNNSTYWKRFSDIGIERYHELAHLVDHGALWAKPNRIFSREAAKVMRSLSLIKNLEKAYGPFIVADEENIGYEEFVWRLVRPNQPSDIGPLHADDWFLQLGHGVKPPSGMKAVKVWVALCCEPGLNGLKVVSDSQKKQWRYHGEFRHGFVKPQFDDDENKLNIELLNTVSGDAVVFHDKLLHAGAVNRGRYCRISMEFMLFVQR
ncbi:MAG: hypothetical protein A3I77_03935 [Gammaproteobacteria bacterium RIFCSPLOWO2_02_FULL_42_14]|nr:MAG: hypothetical protein A3B71_05240 [Gammaproteobacteria bacterium RIFCSPHIGHO2_02_FULL_42_43]OGT27517.1 MAG: hypothetical protein A2624_03690 [Gammaproteobacteria bacterium RIFCSPHIGHO2_01_FULL_42_8]OGT51401.1 MAG: hypothetical protein A3E54_05005 [Gammaproteobacteria bacterium RIFCSPHIGHO2_12_FULL_41_25]OGT62103.1 MAG: hypothetical protein A3I77_03935 [Gammaproteobacteria bacterium RIFCSPLOWO2_02_FULL_42_14]